MFCSKCGARIDVGDEYCVNCGAAVRKGVLPEVEINTPEDDAPEYTETASTARKPNWYIFNWSRVFREQWRGTGLKHHLAWLGI
ncbi:MAG: zinc ribbon domain-containing protein, partial [Lachnospiraceae bacterium]|nr:zinc ribbon domain-containing protein [Lachnospiraceae bacterium]